MLCKQRGDDQIDALKCKEASHLKRSAKVESAFTFTAFIVYTYYVMYLTIIACRTNFNPKGKMTRGLKPITVCHFGRRISYLTDITIWYIYLAHWGQQLSQESKSHKFCPNVLASCNRPY